LAVDISGLQYELDFPLKFRKSFQRNTVWWVSATIVSGALLALMPARTKKVPIEVKVKANSKNNAQEGILGAGLPLGALKLAGTLLRPAVTAFIAKKVRESVNPPQYR